MEEGFSMTVDRLCESKDSIRIDIRDKAQDGVTINTYCSK